MLIMEYGLPKFHTIFFYIKKASFYGLNLKYLPKVSCNHGYAFWKVTGSWEHYTPIWSLKPYLERMYHSFWLFPISLLPGCHGWIASSIMPFWHSISASEVSWNEFSEIMNEDTPFLKLYVPSTLSQQWESD